MSDSTVISNADNFSSNIDSGVDPRTGMYSVSINVGRFFSYKSSGSTISVQLTYDASNGLDTGFGRGWGIPISQFSKDNDVLVLSTGQSFKLVWNDEINEYEMPYRKLKDIRVLYIDDSKELKVIHKDGRAEYLDWEEGIHKRTVSPSGLETYYEYGNFHFQSVLWRIYDKTGRELIIDWWTNEWETIIEHRLGGDVGQTITIEKTGGGGFKRLSNISFPGLSTPMYFQYRYVDESGYDVIEKSVHATGLVEQMEYLDHGHSLPENAPLVSIPFIQKYTMYPGEAQPLQFVVYDYSDKNYLGFGSDRAWMPGEDTLFKARSDYRYTTIETHNSNKVVEREYNKYHLIEKARYYDNGDLYKEESYEHFANLDADIENQPAIYSLLKKETTTYHYLGVSRTFTKAYDYDDYGNLTLEREVDGSQTTRTFYSASGESGACPASPHDMVYLVKEECFVPVKSNHNEAARKEVMTYQSLASQDGNYFIVLSSLRGDNYSKEWGYYDDINRPLVHGRVLSEKSTVGSYAETVHYDYHFASNGLKTSATLLTHDGIEVTESETVEYFFYLSIERIDSQGVVSRFTYDQLGRMTQALFAPDTEFETSKNIVYWVGGGNNVTTEMDAKGNATSTKMNNVGNVVSVKNSPSGSLPKTVHQFKYDEYGLVCRKIDTDWLGSTSITLETQFTYDVNGNVCSVTHSDGRQEVIEQNPVLLRTTYNLTGLLSEITTYNLSGQKVEKESRDATGNLLARTRYTYDGYGNLRTTEDTAGRITEVRYDSFDRVVTTERNIDNERVVESFSYPEFTDRAEVSQVCINGVELGLRDFDGLFRVTTEKSADVARSYSYAGVGVRPDSITMPNGELVDVRNNVYLHVSESITLRGRPTLNSLYKYDKQNAQLVGNLNQGSKTTLTRDSYGRVLIEKVELNNGDARQSVYRYSLLGKLLERTDFFGNKTRYEYDKLGRLVSMTDVDSSCKIETIIDYDKYSRPWRYTTQQSSDKAVIELDYNATGLETSRVARFNGVEVFSIKQTYNISLLLDTRIYTDTSGASTEKFDYDELNRLVSYKCEGSNCPQDDYGNIVTQQRFTHDIYSNITQAISSFFDKTSNTGIFFYDPLNPVRLLTVKNTHPSYPKEVLFEYDDLGNLVNDDQGRSYHYNALNQLESADDRDGRELSRYRYDASGRMVSQAVGEDLLYLFYSNGQLSNELSGETYSRYHRGSSRLTGRVVSTESEQKHEFLFGNTQGSIVKTLSDSDSKEERETRRYTPYGEG